MTYISVIIPTFNKSPLICDIVKDLSNQTFKDFEVIIVDDGSTDNTVRALRALRKEERHMKIKIYQTGLTDEFGMCKAINTGLRKASGSVTLLMNDDIYLHSTCLEQHMLAHKRIRSRHAFIGPRFRCPPYSLGKLYEDGRAWTRKHKDADKTKSGYPVYRKKLMVSSNISISTNKLCKMGGYNEFSF